MEASGPVVWEASDGRLSAAPRSFGTASSPSEIAENSRWASLNFSPDGNRVFGAYPGTFGVWDAATARLERRADADASSADGRRIARLAGGDGAAVDILDPETSSRVARVSLTRPRADVLALSPHGGRVAAFERRTDSVEVVDVGEAGAARATLRQAGDRLDAVRFSPDGRRLFVALTDGTARIWDIARRRPIAQLSGHVRPLWSGSFSADGRFVVTGGSDGTSRVWAAATGRPVAVLPSGGGAAFGPGARSVVIVAGLTPGPQDVSAIRSCEACADWPELLRRAEERATRGLTAAERDRFIGD
jgi:WD40 repeat protein